MVCRRDCGRPELWHRVPWNRFALPPPWAVSAELVPAVPPLQPDPARAPANRHNAETTLRNFLYE